MPGTGRPWAIAAVIAVLAAGLWLAYSHGRSVENSEWQARWNDRNAEDHKAQALAQTKNRTEEQRRQSAANQVANDARQEQAAALADAAGADAAGDRLRVEAGKLAAAASCVPGDSGIADRGKNAARAAMVLSDLLGRADARARELAKYADSARIAGQACEAAYRSLLIKRG
ncbi:DUF2514 domain-containing protein [Pseudomonas sp. Irchel 3A18]|uniref:DUF2514 domain-containing protein n=1 Tax=Pseudomonas sp. Irchel 3A18 TaxID=2008905 RepID=UPI000BA3597C|nr:DUF2514 domain-containing protein [Pseudomonas sp. Irchel 3A18]